MNATVETVRENENESVARIVRDDGTEKVVIVAMGFLPTDSD